MTVTQENAEDIYLSHVDQPYGQAFADLVGHFQESALAKGAADVDAAFALAVGKAVNMLPKAAA